MPSDSLNTCWTVLRAASAGDDAARALFARNYSMPIRSYLAHRWNESPWYDELDDALQDVFVECLKPGGVLDAADSKRGDFRALLYGVVRNVARRFEERAAKQYNRQAKTSLYLDDIPAEAEALSRVFDREWAQSLFRDAVLRHALAARNGDLDSRRRYRILRLRHQKGLPVREIAAKLNEPDVDAVHNAYRRARREYRVFLREVVAFHTGAPNESIDAECRRVMNLLGS